MRRSSSLLVLASLCLAAVGAVAQVDHRAAQSPVKNQGLRGTCVAFAMCSALETFPGVPTNLSEQMLYATVKLHQNNVDRWLRSAGLDPTISEGDVFGTYLPLMELLGTCHGSVLPYNPNPRAVGPAVPPEMRRFIELAQITPADLDRLRDAFGKYGLAPGGYELLQGAAARDVERIKAELDGGRLAIPVTYLVHGQSWSELSRFANRGSEGRRDIVHPGMIDQFARPGGPWMSYNDARVEAMRAREDLVAGVRSGAWVRRRAHQDEGGDAGYGGHAVLIVGYDDHGFIVKNSWGERWGNKGYCRVSFDYHRLYTGEALLIDRVRVRAPSLSPFERTAAIREGWMELKVQPRLAGDTPGLHLSVWSKEPRDPPIEIVQYVVEGRSRFGGWSEIDRATVVAAAAGGGAGGGAPYLLSGGAYERARSSRELRVTVRYGHFPLGDASRLDEAVFLASRWYGPFRPGLEAAVDLPPNR